MISNSFKIASWTTDNGKAKHSYIISDSTIYRAAHGGCFFHFGEGVGVIKPTSMLLHIFRSQKNSPKNFS